MTTDHGATRRITASLLALTLAVPLSACSRYDGDPDGDNGRRPATAKAPAPTNATGPAQRTTTPDAGAIKALCDSVHATDVETLYNKADVIIAAANHPGVPAGIKGAVADYVSRTGMPEQGVVRTKELNRRYGDLIVACQETGWEAPKR